MKSSEIIGALPGWSKATAAEIIASQAWAMPCRLGDKPCIMRLDALRPADTLDISVVLEDEPHTLSITDSPAFEELHGLWPSRAEVPEPILLALVEKECGPLLQLIENFAHRQLKIVGLASSPASENILCAQIYDDGNPVLSFSLTSSPALVKSLGQLRFIDLSHASVRETSLAAETEVASFTLPAADVSTLAVGDVLLVSEIGTMAPRIVVDRRFVVDESGVSKYAEDGRFRVVDAEPHAIALGELFDRAENPAPSPTTRPAQLRLVQGGRTIASGRLENLGDHPALIVESL